MGEFSRRAPVAKEDESISSRVGNVPALFNLIKDHGIEITASHKAGHESS